MGSLKYILNTVKTMSDYSSCLSALDQMINLFGSVSAQNEWQSAKDIGFKRSKLFENMENYKQHLQHTLDSINSSHESYKSLIANPTSTQLHEDFKRRMAEKLKIEEEIQALQAELKSMQEHGNTISDTENCIDNLTQQKKAKIQQKLPALKHTFKLYKRIFCMELEQNNNDILSGIIGTDNSDPQKLPFKEFTFEKNKLSHFDLVNKMWQLYEDDIHDEMKEMDEIMQST